MCTTRAWSLKAPPCFRFLRLCCQCGIAMDSNPANMCVTCLRTHVDITQDIPKQGILQFCRNCERYLQPPFEWISCALESKELLGLCLRKLKALSKVKLVDAGFIWTEPHSKRIKVTTNNRSEETIIVTFIFNCR